MEQVVRETYGLVYTEEVGFKDTYGGAVGTVFLECMRIRPEKSESKTAVAFSHPVGGGGYLPMVTALAAMGVHCLYINTRYRGNDSALIMEKCAADLGAGIRDAKKRFGYERIVLGGWSGGGSLSLFYQDQAETPTLTHTPAGDPFDMTAMDLPQADGVMLLAAHVSRAATLTEWIDPSITDENAPFDRDQTLNIYDPANPNQPPYDAGFLTRYREAQVARNKRITDWVKETLLSLKEDGEPNMERGFTTHGTMADPRFLDPAVDPSDRRARECYLGVPRIVNDGPVGLARFSTLRSWLSQWGLETTNAHGEKNAARISCPVLVVNNTADLACTPSHAQRLFDAVSHDRKAYHDIQGADHYYIEKPELAGMAAGLCKDWMAGEGLL
ncbi:MAG: alpha/beta hydrolase [Pseudomonadota bacterium]